MRIRLVHLAASLLATSALPLAAHATISYSTVSTTGGDSYSGVMIDNFSTIRSPETSYWFSGGVETTCGAITGDTTSCNSSVGNPPKVSGSPDNARPSGTLGSFLEVSPGPNPAQYGVGFFDIGGLSKDSSVSFDWGSVDEWNFVQLLDASGNALITVGGTDIGASFLNGNPVSPGDERLTFTWSASDPVATIQFGDTFGPAMEVANVTTATPEPASIGLLATGLLGLAGVARRRMA